MIFMDKEASTLLLAAMEETKSLLNHTAHSHSLHTHPIQIERLWNVFVASVLRVATRHGKSLFITSFAHFRDAEIDEGNLIAMWMNHSLIDSNNLSIFGRFYIMDISHRSATFFS